jgi:hypothetical protein
MEFASKAIWCSCFMRFPNHHLHPSTEQGAAVNNKVMSSTAEASSLVVEAGEDDDCC